MNYEEAKQLAHSWSQGVGAEADGWRAVLGVLLQRVESLEKVNADLTRACRRVQSENEALSVDLGIRNQDFKLPQQQGLQTIADIVRECEKRR